MARTKLGNWGLARGVHEFAKYPLDSPSNGIQGWNDQGSLPERYVAGRINFQLHLRIRSGVESHYVLARFEKHPNGSHEVALLDQTDMSCDELFDRVLVDIDRRLDRRDHPVFVLVAEVGKKGQLVNIGAIASKAWLVFSDHPFRIRPDTPKLPFGPGIPVPLIRDDWELRLGASLALGIVPLKSGQLPHGEVESGAELLDGVTDAESVLRVGDRGLVPRKLKVPRIGVVLIPELVGPRADFSVDQSVELLDMATCPPDLVEGALQ